MLFGFYIIYKLPYKYCGTYIFQGLNDHISFHQELYIITRKGEVNPSYIQDRPHNKALVYRNFIELQALSPSLYDV